PSPVRTRKPRNATGTTAVTRSTPATKPRAGSKPALQAQAAGTYAKILLIVPAIIAWGRLKRLAVPDPEGKIAEELSLTDDEAAPIARVLARVTMSNERTAKIVKPIVENEDVIDAAFAFWEWNKRVDDRLSMYRRSIVQTEVRTDGALRPDEVDTSQGDGNGVGGGDFAYNGD